MWWSEANFWARVKLSQKCRVASWSKWSYLLCWSQPGLNQTALNQAKSFKRTRLTFGRKKSSFHRSNIKLTLKLVRADSSREDFFSSTQLETGLVIYLSRANSRAGQCFSSSTWVQNLGSCPLLINHGYLWIIIIEQKDCSYSSLCKLSDKPYAILR